MHDLPTFTWSSVAGANHYYVWVNDMTTGQSPAVSNSNVSGTSWTTTTALTPGQSYEWYVGAVSTNGTTDLECRPDIRALPPEAGHTERALNHK